MTPAARSPVVRDTNVDQAIRFATPRLWKGDGRTSQKTFFRKSEKGVDKPGIRCYNKTMERGSHPGPRPSGKRARMTALSTSGHPLGRDVKDSRPRVRRKGMANHLRGQALPLVPAGNGNAIAKVPGAATSCGTLKIAGQRLP